ncbi:hypothetical protein Trydic_g1115, partial [Trypoxylus dichotomus]
NMDDPVKKGRQGKVYCGKEKQVILNAFCYLNKTTNVPAAAKETSKALECNERIVYSLRTQRGGLKSPPKKPKGKGYQKNTHTLVYGMQV